MRKNVRLIYYDAVFLTFFLFIEAYAYVYCSYLLLSGVVPTVAFHAASGLWLALALGIFFEEQVLAVEHNVCELPYPVAYNHHPRLARQHEV